MTLGYNTYITDINNVNKTFINMKLKKLITAGIAIIAILGIAFTMQSFTAPESVASASSTKTFVKTKYKCSKCSCSGYWGYKHQNGTYEGACSNTDAYGHRCGHSPEKHGLRKW